MHSSFSMFILVCIPLCLASCSNEKITPEETSIELSPEVRERCIEKGSAATEALMKNLSEQLKAAMTTGGPVAAVSVCQNVAQPSTEAVSSAFAGLTISRTSLKVRNPKNSADNLDRATLESWQKLVAQGQPLPKQELFAIDEKTVRFYRPIVNQELCIRCHGPSESMEPKLRALIDELYPQDQARGYQAGDLRGAFRVDMDLLKTISITPDPPSFHP